MSHSQQHTGPVKQYVPPWLKQYNAQYQRQRDMAIDTNKMAAVYVPVMSEPVDKLFKPRGNTGGNGNARGRKGSL